MQTDKETSDVLSPWWKHSVVIIMIVGFTILIWLSVKTYSDSPPIPAKVSKKANEPP